MRPPTASNAFAAGLKELVASGASADALVAYCQKHLGNGERRPLSERLPAQQYVPVILEFEMAGEIHDPAHLAGQRADLHELVDETFSNVRGALEVIERGSGLLVLVPAAREIDASNARTAAAMLPRTAAKRKSELRFFGGVGECVRSVEIERAIAQAETALAIGKRIFRENRVSIYDALGIYPLLFEGADTERLCEFARRTLEPLRTYDEKHQTELEKTLRLYFAVGQNVKTASEQLHVHRHTVFYRLRQINEICNRSLDDEHDQLTLRMAVAIDTLNS